MDIFSLLACLNCHGCDLQSVAWPQLAQLAHHSVLASYAWTKRVAMRMVESRLQAQQNASKARQGTLRYWTKFQCRGPFRVLQVATAFLLLLQPAMMGASFFFDHHFAQPDWHWQQQQGAQNAMLFQQLQTHPETVRSASVQSQLRWNERLTMMWIEAGQEDAAIKQAFKYAILSVTGLLAFCWLSLAKKAAQTDAGLLV